MRAQRITPCGRGIDCVKSKKLCRTPRVGHRREGSVLGGQSGNLLLGLSLPGFDPEADLSCLGEAFDSVPEALAAIQVHAGSNVDWDSYELHRGDDEEYWPDDDD